MTWPTTTTPENPAQSAPSVPADLEALSPGNLQLPSRIPRRQRWTTRTKIMAAAAGLGVVLVALVIYFMIRSPFQRTRTDLITHRVRYERMELTIVERGALESAKNSDIYCNVKSGTKGST